MTRAVSFPLDDDKLRFLDQLAATMDLDRSGLLNEVVSDFLDVQAWQLAGIDRAIAEADAGKFASEAEVRAAFDAFKSSPAA